MAPGDWTRSAPKAVELVQLPAAAIDALAAGDLSAANDAAPVALSPYFAGPQWRSTWRMRSRQLEADPAVGGWITGVIVDRVRQVAVGRAGFHGPPDPRGMVELGYAVEPTFRRQGYARAALEVLLARAADEPSVRTVRASIRPDNAASRGLVVQYGFVEVGAQWDDEDGLETIFELDAGRRATTASCAD